MNSPMPSFQPGRAALFNGAGHPFEQITRDVPVLKEGEILVRNLYTTLCGSDVHTFCGRRAEPANVVLGHEIVGEIEWIDISLNQKDLRGNVLKKGDRITWSIFSKPATSIPPHPDMPQKSSGLFKYGHALAKGNDVFNGGLADYCILLPETAILTISKEIPLKVAATINCAHATTAGALRVAGDIKGKKVLVVGMGLLGLSCLAMCKEAGAAWVGAVDNDAQRLAWSTSFGADASYPFDDAAVIPDADIVIDMTGVTKAMEFGLSKLAIGGIAVWIGAVYPNSPVQVDAEKIVRKIIQIRGLHNYNYEDLLGAAVFIENFGSKYPFESLVEKEFSISEIQTAFEYASDSKPVRVGIPIGK